MYIPTARTNLDVASEQRLHNTVSLKAPGGSGSTTFGTVINDEIKDLLFQLEAYT